MRRMRQTQSESPQRTQIGRRIAAKLAVKETRKPLTVALILFLLLASPLTSLRAQSESGKRAASAAASAHGNVDYITADILKNYLYFVSSDEMEGRDTPSRGLDTTAKFISMNLARWGVKPAGDDGTYFQRIALRRNLLAPAETHAEINGHSYAYGEDFLASVAVGAASAPLVYVGHGWMVKAKNLNPYQNIDVKDKIVVYLGGFPKGLTQADFAGKQGEDWEIPAEYARKHGAKGLIVIAGFQTQANWKASQKNATTIGSLGVEKFANANQPLPSMVPSAAMLAALFQGERKNAADALSHALSGERDEPFEFSADKKVSFTVGVKSVIEMTQNVVGILEGSDPTLKNEYVALGAHYDHVGKGTPVEDPHRFPAKDGTTNDLIYNGADDDGSGTVAILTIAEAFSHGTRPKRSILFVWHCAEEKGLWGSQYFSENPTVPLKQIVTQLNIDMIGRCKQPDDTNPANNDLVKPNEVFVIGSKMMSSELGELSEKINHSYLNLDFNYRYDDPNDPNHFFERSDHYNYARKGIPIIFYMDGDHEDYHRPSDTADKIDYPYMEKVTRTVFALADELANRPQRPRVDKSVPGFDGN